MDFPPLLDRVAEQRLDLVAREDVGAGLVQGVHVNDERQLLDERSVASLDLSSRSGRCTDGVHVRAAVHECKIGWERALAVTLRVIRPRPVLLL